MKSISIRQPWAFAILAGGMDVVNLRWATDYRGPVAIHAVAGMTASEVDDFRAFVTAAGLGGDWVAGRNAFDLPRGGIVGVATIADCVTDSRSLWFRGPFGFVLEDARPVPFLPCQGAPGLFDLPPDAAAHVRRYGG